jgi:predicted nucleic acid-binding protein
MRVLGGESVDVAAVVAIDSMVLVWGVRRRDGTPEQLQRARWLFQELAEDKSQIVVSPIALAEYLTPVTESARAAVVNELNQRFTIPVFDEKAAAISAEIFNVGLAQRPKNVPGGRTCLRADALIIASSYVSGATVFYSHDADCRKLAEEVMVAKDLPAMARRLFEEPEN